ncbi:MAG: cobalamin B12-binding domain-containing protein [Proteobacteria bacterium]|nr:cobalamin B12-binding domain-containing protein [Pseudomonadota bacterium]
MRDKFVDLDDGMRCEDWASATSTEGQVSSARAADLKAKRQLFILERIVSDHIVPRLLLADRVALPLAAPSADHPHLSTVVNEFTELVIKRDAKASVEFFADLRDKGLSVETLFQDLLAPTARRLGELWDEDINDFMDVTQGVMTLQIIVHEFSSELQREARTVVVNRRALLLPVPDEQHNLGVSLVGEYFRREGWRVWGGPPRSTEEIVELVSGQWFDVVGLSASRLSEPAGVEAQINALREASHNSELMVLVGGQVFARAPELASAVGADATAVDGRQAMLQVAKMIKSR